MRHNVSGRKLKRTKSHRDALLHNMASSLFEHKRIHTTEAKAKELRPFAEGLITKAKMALARERQHLLPEGQTIDIHNRRLVYRYIRNKGVVQELFDSIAPVVESRNGGYTRITKTGTRRGDGGRTAIIELVDWSAPIDGAVSSKPKRKKKVASKKLATPEATNKTGKNKVAKVATSEEAKAEVITETISETVTETTPAVSTAEVVAEVTTDENSQEAHITAEAVVSEPEVSNSEDDSTDKTTQE